MSSPAKSDAIELGNPILLVATGVGLAQNQPMIATPNVKQIIFSLAHAAVSISFFVVGLQHIELLNP
jgi:hypothetical protein